jgi:hypothetical protein
MLLADEPRKIIQNWPRRVSPQVATWLAIESLRPLLLGKETTKWLHEVNGDPRLGRAKADVRKEIYTDEVVDPDLDFGGGMGTSEAEKDAKALAKAKVTIEDPPSTGMPRSYLDGLSDVQLTIAHQIPRMPKVATRWEVIARHTGTLLGRPATGADVTVNGVTILTFAETRDEEGKLAFNAIEDWTCWDLPSVLQQIGVNP